MNFLRIACMTTLLAGLPGLASAQSVTLTVAPSSPVTYGTPLALNAIITIPSGTCAGADVSFQYGGPVAGGFGVFELGHATATVLSSQVECYAVLYQNTATSTIPAGTWTLYAYYLGTGGGMGTTPLTVTPAPTTLTLATSPNPSTVGQAVTLTATVFPASATGSVSFRSLTMAYVQNLPSVSLVNGSAILTYDGLALGSHALEATYPGGGNYTESYNSVDQTVNQAPTTTSLQAAPSSSTLGQTVTLTATVSPSTASGTVTFLDGSTNLGTAPVSAGTANFSTSTLAIGNHSLTASYGGDTNDTPSASQPVAEFVSQPTTTTLAADPNPSLAGQNVILTATVTPGNPTGTVSFVDGANLLGTGSLNNGAATFATTSFSVGSHSLTASYSGDTNNAPSTSSAVSQVVAPAGARTITSLVPSTAAAGGAAFTLTVNGTGFSSGAVAQWNGTALSTTFVSATQVTAAVPVNLLASPGTVVITVATVGGTAGGPPFIVNPSGQPCSFSLTTSSATFPATGGSGSIAVTASRTDCTWTGNTTAAWISGFNTVTGSGTLKYTVGANAGATSRIAAIAIGAETFDAIQGGTTCTYSLPFGSQALAAAGGPGAAIVRAPPGCAWTATSAAPSVTITPPGTGSGDGTAAYTVTANASATALSLPLTIANKPYTVIQSGAGSNPNCTASVPSAPQVALETRTGLLGDLVLTCSGLSGSPKADVALTLNTDVTNTLTGSGNSTDAVLIVNGGTPQSGVIGGYNSLRWFGVPIVPAGDGTATLRISKVRADASILQPGPITGQVSVNILTQVSASQSTLTAVPVTGAQQTMANAAPTLIFTRIQANAPTGGAQTLLPLTFQETGAAAFQANTTRLRVALTNLPATVQVYAPVYPAEGTTRAQLYSADANGSGGSPVAGSPIAGVTGNYQLLTVTGGNKATGTWLVLAVDPAQVDTWTFPLLLVNAATGDLNQIEVSGSVAPVSDVTIASAAAPSPRYRDLIQSQQSPQLPVVLRTDPSSSSFSVVNDSTDPTQTATNVKITGNLSSDESVVSCTVSGGGSCTQTGNQVQVTCGTLAPGQSCSGTLVTQPDPSLPAGTVLDNSLSAVSDQANLDPLSATHDSSSIVIAGAPVPVSESPASGGGSAASFAFQFSDPAGYQSLGVVNVLINNFLDGRSACYLAYVVPSGTLVLVDDGGDAGGPYAGSVALGSSTAIQNSQCAVTLVSAVGSGTTLTLILNIAFKPGFGGNRIMYVAARDQGTGNSNWQALGVWQPPFTPPGTIAVTGVTPGRGAAPSGTNQEFFVTLTDSKGASDLGVVDVLINNFIDGRQACFLAYVALSNTLILIDDLGEAGGPYAGSMTLNGSGSIQNSQCMVSGAGSAVSSVSNTLTLTLNITFKAAFAGNRVVYAAGRDSAGGNNTDWQALATFTVQ
ncbi:exported hypothetical protein [Candidatus Sulfopaludibacter sp. SbA4]|nr:exported hypothetical protein [Candidatus Sulfopaludibacter sp. SbA4]